MGQILKIVVGFIVAICVAGYAIHRHRERAKWAKVRKEQLKRLRWLKKKIER